MKMDFLSVRFQLLPLQRLQRLQLRPTVQRAAWQERQTDHFARWERSSPNPSPSSSPPTTWHPAPFTATTLSAAIPRAARSFLRALPSPPTLPWGSEAAALSVPRWALRWEDLGQQVRTAAPSWGGGKREKQMAPNAGRGLGSRWSPGAPSCRALLLIPLRLNTSFPLGTALAFQICSAFW